MDKRTVQSAHSRIDALEKQMIEIQTEMKIQFKDLYNRMKRMEAIMIGITGASLLLLIRMSVMG
jgi:flagellar capping protein FliD